MISTQKYLRRAEILLKAGEYTDGCSVPLIRKWIHEYLKESKLLCAAHDYGNLGKIQGVSGGWENNWQTFKAHWSINIGYGIWGTVVSLSTLPWSVWRRNWGIDFLDVGPFHGILILFPTVITLMIKFPG